MRHVVCLLWGVFLSIPARADDEQDRYEEQAVTRVAQQKAERSLRGERGERANTLRDLEAAFPGKVNKTEPNDSEGEAWFALVSGNGDEWRKADAVAAGLGPMFERWRQRLQLGPVPSIKRDEFLKFSKQIIDFAATVQRQGVEINTQREADKVFRVLDLNSDGQLSGSELSPALRADKTLTTGRVSKELYREYFQRRVEKKSEALSTALKANEALMRRLNTSEFDTGIGLPEWFTTLDADEDKQISLYEWRRGGKDIKAYLVMDLNGDGLVTTEEYVRWAKKKREEEDQRREDDL